MVYRLTTFPRTLPSHHRVFLFVLFLFSFFFLQRSFPRSVKTPAHRAITFHRAGKSIGESWVFTVHRGRWRESAMKSRKTATSCGVGKGTKRKKGERIITWRPERGPATADSSKTWSLKRALIRSRNERKIIWIGRIGHGSYIIYVYGGTSSDQSPVFRVCRFN